MQPKCEKCGRWPRRDGERFCRDCRSSLLRKMYDDKYLTPYGSRGPARGGEARENTTQTKHGTGQ